MAEEGFQRYQETDPYYDYKEWTGREEERDSSFLYFCRLNLVDMCKYLSQDNRAPTGI